MSRIEVLEQQVELVSNLQEVTEEQDSLITQLKALLEARGSTDRPQVCLL